MSVDHYENFPVASWLCPPRLRPPIRAIYAFARTADDIADEGDAPAHVRLADLASYRVDLAAVTRRLGVSARWAHVFEPLREAIRGFQLPVELLAALLDAFNQDTLVGAYADRAAVLDYCRRSANPIGRLLLHLYGVADPASLARSDAICTGLQLANFWQDLSLDLPRGRVYVPETDWRRFGVDPAGLRAGAWGAGVEALLADLVGWARALLREGAPLVHAIPGRAGWELRLVVQGGLRMLERVERLGARVLRERPTLGAADALPIAWHSAFMRAGAAPAVPQGGAA